MKNRKVNPAVRFRRIYMLLLLAFCLYVPADTFLIPRAEVNIASVTAQPAAEDSSPAQAENAADLTEGAAGVTETSITVSEHRYLETDVYVAEITLSDPSGLKTAFARDTYGRNISETVRSAAERAGALLAVNGDYYGSRRSGYVIRNGVLYRSVSAGNEDLCVWEDGSFSIIDEDEISVQALLDAGAQQVFSFGPGLVKGGEISVGLNDEVDQSMTSNPRTALGITQDGTYLFVVSDGRTGESAGLSLYELAEFMRQIGAVTAYNLDGGGSSTMYYDGEVINFPTTSGGRYSERQVSDIVYIGY